MARAVRLANEAWEALFRAQATISRELAAADIWGDLLPREYAVLHALSNAPARGLRITELGEDVLITQPGMSRLIARLESRGLVAREDDPKDARACRIRLTGTGLAAQRRTGGALVRQVAKAMTRALDPGQLADIRDLSGALLAAAEREAATTTAPKEPKAKGKGKAE
ncbi:MarR family winged helix-turn-helix transcriptional regulator [Streptomyces sp. NBC_01506]|uniref:MarR family winged helix-turn-helix transcriptional regulator n=1 Tax=Streptomyces sp. NBC_01506 TaxID=2903887 RepID=UPI003870CF1E